MRYGSRLPRVACVCDLVSRTCAAQPQSEFERVTERYSIVFVGGVSCERRVSYNKKFRKQGFFDDTYSIRVGIQSNQSK